MSGRWRKQEAAIASSSPILDTIVIGGSAGSFTALKEVLPRLPEDLPAAVLVTLHTATGETESTAAVLLQAHSALPVREAEDGLAIEPGTVTIAPPDRHMLLGEGHVHLRRGPRENNFRPAVDPLFRSAAIYRSTRAAGVVLSGLMDDGAAGARAMRRTGGAVLVQDPATAEFPDMPRAALAAVPDAEPVALEALAACLAAMAGSPVAGPRPVPLDVGIELKIAGLEGATMAMEERLGELSPYNCPHCNGVLWEIEDGPLTRYRCHTGHAYTADALGVSQEEALERSLFDALRAHRGRAHLLRQTAAKTSSETLHRRLEDRARACDEDAGIIEEMIRTRRAA